MEQELIDSACKQLQFSLVEPHLVASVVHLLESQFNCMPMLNVAYLPH